MNYMLSDADLAVLKRVIRDMGHIVPGIDTTGNGVFRSASPTYMCFFPVLLVQNGGVDGTLTTAATWTYDVYPAWDVGLTTKLNSSPLAQTKPRSLLSHKQQPSSTANGTASYGVAFWGGSPPSIMLWDAGEVLNITGC